jgi:hypothetical protein
VALLRVATPAASSAGRGRGAGRVVVAWRVPCSRAGEARPRRFEGISSLVGRSSGWGDPAAYSSLIDPEQLKWVGLTGVRGGVQ